MGDAYTFRLCGEEDLGQIARLVNTVLAVDFGEDYFRELYFGNPAGTALSVLVLHGDRIVGQIGAVPVRFRAGGRDVIGAQELDVAIYEEHRRLEVFLVIGQKQKELFAGAGVAFCFGFGIGSTSQMVQALGWKKVICAIPRLVKVLDTEPFLRKRLASGLLSKVAAPAGNALLRIRYPGKTPVPAGMRIVPVERFGAPFDDLWERVKDDYPLMGVRDASFLNWRYRDAVHVDYEIFALEETGTGSLAGYVVLGESREGFLIGQIFDLLTPRRDSEEATRCLLRYAVEHFRGKKAASVKCWFQPHTHLYPELTAMGFSLREKEGRDLLFDGSGLEKAGAGADLGAAAADWFFGKGDSDNY
jgi:hypothetical protein